MLKDKLAAIGAASAEKIPPETLAIMKQAKMNLADSGIMEQGIKTGEKIPDFFLEDSEGKQINLAELRSQGSVLLTIYRGVW